MREIAFKDEDLQGTPLELKSGQKEYEELEKQKDELEIENLQLLERLQKSEHEL